MISLVGIARCHGQRMIFARDLIEVPRRRQLETASARLSAEKGLAPWQEASRSPASVASVWRRSRGPFAIVDDGLGVQLVSLAAGFGATP
jgi:hypothetical protein